MAKTTIDASTAPNDLVTYYVPRGEANDEDVFVALNGKSYLLRRGSTVRVPRAVYDILMESRHREEVRDARRRQLAQDAAKREVYVR
jgi:hypothetical protein